MVIKHEVFSKDGLRKETYQYYFNEREMRLMLDDYWAEDRYSGRHGWREVGRWNRHQEHFGAIRRTDIPQRDDVKADVLRRFVEAITVEA